jgi:hypothetical protein
MLRQPIRTRSFSADQFEQLKQLRESKSKGSGRRFRDSGRVTVLQTLPGTPSAKADSGRATAINGIRLTGWALNN